MEDSWSSAFGDALETDISTLSWVNVLLGLLWPKANTALSKFVHDELTPRLQGALPAPFKQVHFARFTLGAGVPELGPVEVMRHSESHVQVELDLRYVSDIDVLLDAGGGICFGFRQLCFEGRFCISLKPLVARWPLVGAIHVFFASPPRIKLKYRGLADFPGIARKVQSIVDDFMRSTIVLPNFRSLPLARDERIVDPTEAGSQQPLGVLRVRVIRARRLAGANWQMGSVESFTSDPYCVLRLGAATTRTSTVRGSTNPEWPEDEPSAYFVVHHHEQELEIDVLDEDRGVLRRKFVGLLGRMPASSVRTLLHRGEPATPSESAAGSSGGWFEGRGMRLQRRVQLDTSRVNKALLHVNDPVHTGVPSELDLSLEWLHLVASTTGPSPGPATPAAGGAPEGLLIAELHGGTGFPEEAAVDPAFGRGGTPGRGLRWQCYMVGGRQQPVQSRRGTVHSEEFDNAIEAADLPLARCLHDVVDRLVEQDMPLEDIADVVDCSEDVVSQYLQAKADYQERLQQRRQETGEERCVDLRWHQTLTLLVRRPLEATLAVELLDGDDQVVGRLEPFSLHQLFAEGGALPRATFRLCPVEEAPKGHFWDFFPYCSKLVLARGGRYHAVRIDLSLRFQRLVRGSAPRTVVASSNSSSEEVSWRRRASPSAVASSPASAAATASAPRVSQSSAAPARPPPGVRPPGRAAAIARAASAPPGPREAAEPLPPVVVGAYPEETTPPVDAPRGDAAREDAASRGAGGADGAGEVPGEREASEAPRPPPATFPAAPAAPSQIFEL